MKILSIDTSSNICSVAILENTTLIKKIELDSGLTHSENLMPMIKQILEETNLHLSDINLFVCDKGPGSFTGIRIGVATVKAFSDSLNIPTIGISSLEALAYNVQNDGLICSLIDAKNSNVYYSLYKLENNNYTLLEDFSADHIDTVIELLKKYDGQITFVGDGAICNKEKILSSFATNSIFAQDDKNKLDSYTLGLAGFNSYLNKKQEPCLPLYLRKPQAERMLEQKGLSTNAN